MIVNVTYAGGGFRRIATSGEPMVSPDSLARPGSGRENPPLMAVGMRVRSDLAASGAGLVVEIVGWVSDLRRSAPARISDFWGESEVARPARYALRSWEVLPASELERAVDVDVDGRVHLCRVGGRLLDLTAYERLEARLLSAAEVSSLPLARRVLLVHSRLALEHPGKGDAELGDLYGLGDLLVESARLLAPPDEEEGADEKAAEPHVPADGLDQLCASVADAETREEQVDCLTRALMLGSDLTPDMIMHALTARGFDAAFATSLLDEVQSRMDTSDMWA